MIPQVVFTSGSSTTNANQSEITAYLATSSKQVMTTLPIKIVSANSGEVEKIPINPINKKQADNVFKRKGDKIEKKPTNHNEVEKRYRKSITDTLEELKETLFGGDTKVCDTFVSYICFSLLGILEIPFYFVFRKF